MDKLSDRLQAIANNIDINDSFCDIGTDHGYLPIYIKELNPNRKVILADVSFGSLEKAKLNCNKLSIYEYDFRLGDGLKVIDNNEVDSICIAGMGGLLISKILEDDLNKSHSIKKYVLQPRNHVGELRHFLLNNGFQISKEELVKEGRFICEILTIMNNEKNDQALDYNVNNIIEWEIPKTLLETKSELLEEYLKRKLKKEKFILLRLLSSTKIPDDKIKDQEYRIKYIQDMLEKL